MRSVTIQLPSTQAVQDFVEKLSPLEGNFDLIQDGYILDARSLMGIFSLDLSKPIQLRIQNDTEDTLAALCSYVVPAKA